MSRPLAVTWADGTQIELTEMGYLTFVNAAGVGAQIKGPLAELVNMLRTIVTTYEGSWSGGDEFDGWSLGWEATEDDGVGVAVAATGGGGRLTVEGMTATHEEAADLYEQVDAFVGTLR